jgi:hypothetical protein
MEAFHSWTRAGCVRVWLKGKERRWRRRRRRRRRRRWRGGEGKGQVTGRVLVEIWLIIIPLAGAAAFYHGRESECASRSSPERDGMLHRPGWTGPSFGPIE